MIFSLFKTKINNQAKSRQYNDIKTILNNSISDDSDIDDNDQQQLQQHNHQYRHKSTINTSNSHNSSQLKKLFNNNNQANNNNNDYHQIDNNNEYYDEYNEKSNDYKPQTTSNDATIYQGYYNNNNSANVSGGGGFSNAANMYSGSTSTLNTSGMAVGGGSASYSSRHLNNPIPYDIANLEEAIAANYNTLDTHDIAVRLKEILTNYEISREVFGEAILNASRKVTNYILNAPKTFQQQSKLYQERYLKVKMWLDDPNKIEKIKKWKTENNCKLIDNY